jgi:hypothetical protein
MANTKIKFEGVGDFSQFIKTAKNTFGILQNTLGKKGLKLFDDETTNFLKGQGRTALTQMRTELGRLVTEYKQLEDVISKTADSEEAHKKALVDRLKTLEKMNTLYKSMQAGAAVVGTSAATGRTGMMQRAGGALAGAASGVLGAAGLGGAASVIGSGTVLGAAFAGLTVAVSRVVSVFGQFEAAIPNMLAGRALGLGQTPSARELSSGLSAGFDIQDVMNQRLGVARAFGTRRSTRGQQNILANTQFIGRILGIDPSEISSAGNQLRNVMGGEGALKALSNVLSKALSEGMDKSQASHFLAASVGLLSEINKTGMQSTSIFANAMGGLVKAGMAPEVASRALSGIQGAITGSTGENAQFFRFAAARGGIGAGSMLGSIFATQQGLAGIDPAQFLKQTGNNTRALSKLRQLGLVGGAGYSQRFAQGILSQLNAAAPETDDLSGFSRRIAFMQERFGVKTPAEAFQIENILKKMSEGGMSALTKGERAKFEDLGKDPAIQLQKEMLSVMKGSAGETAKKLAEQQNTSFALAAESVPAMLRLKDALISLDMTILKTFGFLSNTKDAVTPWLESLKTGAANFVGGFINPRATMKSDIFGGPIVDVLSSALDKIKDLLKEGNDDRKKAMPTKGANFPPSIKRGGSR